MATREPWTNIEIRPAAPATVDYNQHDGTYAIDWPSVGLAVLVNEEELRSLVADAIAVQTLATSRSDAR